MDFGVFNLSGAQQFIILLMLLASELRFELTPLHCLTVEPGMGWDGMGWDGMGWHGMGWHGMGWDGMTCVLSWSGDEDGNGAVLDWSALLLRCT